MPPLIVITIAVDLIIMKTEKEIIREERQRLVPMLCGLCSIRKSELVKDAMGNYAHRSKVGAWLEDCRAAALHRLLETAVAVHLKEED